MKNAIIFMLLILNIPVFAGKDKHADKKRYLDKYDEITAHFLYTDELNVNLQLERKIKTIGEDRDIRQILTYQRTDDHYLKISDEITQEQKEVKTERFYYSPSGEPQLAETEVNHKEHMIFLYDQDNPITYSKSIWNSKLEQYDEVDFGTLNEGEDHEALDLLKQSIGLYNTAQEFMDNLPKQ